MRLLIPILVFCSSICLAQSSLPIIKSIPIEANNLQVDELGNAYVLRKDNALIKYNEKGDSVANYIALNNGQLSFIDVTNPLRLLLYYPRFAKLVLLDRMLAPKGELNLRKLNLLNSNVIASSAEGNLWVYDQFSATLNKLDMELNYIVRGNDLRQQLSELPTPHYMVERERKVFMADSTQGVLIFDQYGTYLNTLALSGIRQMQIVGNQIIYRKENVLYAYDFQSFNETTLMIPHTDSDQIIHAVICRNVLYVLYQNRLDKFQVQK